MTQLVTKADAGEITIGDAVNLAILEEMIRDPSCVSRRYFCAWPRGEKGLALLLRNKTNTLLFCCEFMAPTGACLLFNFPQKFFESLLTYFFIVCYFFRTHRTTR